MSLRHALPLLMLLAGLSAFAGDAVVTREQAIAIAAKAHDDRQFRYEAFLHEATPGGDYSPQLSDKECELPLHKVRNAPIWRVEAMLTLHGEGVRGANYRYLLDGTSGEVLLKCRR